MYREGLSSGGGHGRPQCLSGRVYRPNWPCSPASRHPVRLNLAPFHARIQPPARTVPQPLIGAVVHSMQRRSKLTDLRLPPVDGVTACFTADLCGGRQATAVPTATRTTCGSTAVRWDANFCKMLNISHLFSAVFPCLEVVQSLRCVISRLLGDCFCMYLLGFCVLF